jgi:precorrin-6B methylase 2
MLTLKHRTLCVALPLVAVAISAAQAWYHKSGSAELHAQGVPGAAAARLPVFNTPPQSRYQFRTIHDPNGTGKFYMGREIALVMGPDGIAWLDRPEREEEERPATVIRALQLKRGDVVADLGAGSGFFTFRIAQEVGTAGKVLAVDIQDEMLRTIRHRAAALDLTNIEPVKATEADPKLPVSGVDTVLMVDVYHELACPFEIMTEVHKALKPDGRVVLVEYRKEDPSVPIKELHKMSIIQLEKEMKVVGLVRLETIETLPLQHIVIFGQDK